MKEKQYVEPTYLEEEDEIDVMDLIRKLFRGWKQILVWCAIAAAVGLVIGFSIPNEYTATSKMAPESVARSSGGGLGSLANLAGINLGSVSTADAVYPDLYPDIIASTPFIVELFPIQVELSGKHRGETVDYYSYLKNYTRVPWWKKVLAAPKRAIGWFTGLFREKVEESKGFAILDPERLTREQTAVANAIRNSISLGSDKKNPILVLNVTAQDPLVAATISREVINRLQTYVTDYRTEKSRKDLAYYQKLYEESRQEYFASQQRYASYVDRNQNVVLQRVKTEQERLQNEMNLNYQLYNTCAQQLQAAKAKVQQETPVFTIINPPQVPLKRSKPSRATILIACIFFGAVLSSVWVLWGRDGIAALKKKEDEGEPAETDEKAPARP